MIEPLTEMKYRINKRIHAEGRWVEAAAVKDDLIREARAAGVSREDAQRQAYLAVEKMFPPLINPTPASNRPSAANDGIQDDHDDHQPQPRSHDGKEGDAAFRSTGAAVGEAGSDPRTRDGDSQVIGLGDLPPDWPRLPANAPLAAEIQWVQANRLQCVREAGERSLVDLSRALTPAPSYAALGWLETSIRAYTKFVDVAAKATAQLEDEREHVRRERMAIDEVRKLLAEMVEG
jgi:hypothetical protein